MWSQLRNESTPGVNWDYCHAFCSDLVDVLSRGLLRRIHGSYLAVSQAARALFDVCALPGQTGATAAEEALRGEAAGQRLRPCAPRVLGYRSGGSSVEALVRLKQAASFRLRYAAGTAVAPNLS
jgi:hypothetical protein